jgi:hypothetical protein
VYRKIVRQYEGEKTLAMPVTLHKIHHSEYLKKYDVRQRSNDAFYMQTGNIIYSTVPFVLLIMSRKALGVHRTNIKCCEIASHKRIPYWREYGREIFNSRKGN